MKRLLLTIVIALSAIAQLSAQTVGVVLSGGGAKGLAHIGLLKSLEENGIPIDYICGTSMGAIIGSLYAIGYTPDEMAEFLSSDDFLTWSKGVISLEDQYYYKTKNSSADWVSIGLKREGTSINPILPTNIIDPEQMDFRFMQMYAQGSARAEYDFSKLLVPFFCVASDVHGNKPVIFTKGNLAQAVRASMTFPGYFRPLMVDSVLLFDGGMQNNFPADLLDQMYHPDVIIGCTVTENPEKPTYDDVYLLLINMFMKKSNFSIPGKGIMIAPKLSKYGIMDFEQIDEIEEIGYNTTNSKLDSIKMLVSRRVSPEAMAQKRKNFTGGFSDMVFENVVVDGVSDLAAGYVEQSIKRGRDTFNFKSLENSYFKLTSDKIIQNIYPQAVYNQSTGHFDLHLDVSAKKALSVKLGGNLSSGNRSFGQIGAEYVFMNRNICTLSASITAGQFYNSADAYFRIDMSPRNVVKMVPPFFVDFRASYNRWNYFKTSRELFFDSEALSQVIQTDKYLGIDLGAPAGTRGILTLGGAYGIRYYNYYQSTSITKNDNADETSMSYGAFKLGYEYNLLNYRQYANKGKFLMIQGSYILGDEEYSPGSTAKPYEDAQESSVFRNWFNLKLHVIKYFEMGRYFCLGSQLVLNINNKTEFSNSISSLLSAYAYNPFPQCQSQILEKYRANQFVGLGLMPIVNIAEKMQLRTEIHVFQPYRYLLTSGFAPTYSEKYPTPRFMGNAALVWQTPIGPLAVTGNYYYKEEKPFRFQVNLGYLLFNRNGTD
jgi:NTE family protein